MEYINTMIFHDDCFNVLPNICSKMVDLVLIDPPYGISKKSLFDKTNDSTTDEMTTKYGKISTDFGDWDKEAIDFDHLFTEMYRVLRPGGTLVCFFDVWKSGLLRDAAESAGFKQPRACQWIKNNPVPINSKRNYLSNAIEFFFTFVKGKKPTFNSEYDNGIYRFPTVTPWESLGHPTQKPVSLIRSIVEKHSLEGDLVLDSFSGSGTTLEACISTNRRCVAIEKNEEYYQMIQSRLLKIKQMKN